MLKFENTSPQENSNHELKNDFVKLCDQFSEFNDYCAFYCKASGALLLHCEGETFKSCTYGAERFANILIQRSQYFDDWLHRTLKKM